MRIRCKTLLGRKNLDFSISCLKSFLLNSTSEIDLIIMDDGTLTTDDVSKLQSELSNTLVVTKAERDEVVNEKLKDYPACFRYRSQDLYANKIFDVALFEEEDVMFIDSDIYFLHRFDMPQLGKTPIFIADFIHAYSFTPVEFHRIKYPIFPRVNTGWFYFPRKYFDLSFLEDLLNDPIIGKGLGRVSWLEQTVWAFLAARCGTVKYFDPRQVLNARHKLTVDDKMVAVHLISTYRGHYSELKLIKPSPQERPVQIETVSPRGFLTIPAFWADRIKKKVYRHLGLHL